MVRIRAVLRSNGERLDLHLTNANVGVLRQAIVQGFKIKAARLFVEQQELLDDSLNIDFLNHQVIHVEEGCQAKLFAVNASSHPQMIIKKMPDDNSCLFHSIRASIARGFTIEGLRELVVVSIMNNPQYSDVVLGKPRQDYIQWIGPGGSGWGGGIELAIFASFFKTELAVVDVQWGHVDVFGEDQQYLERVYLLYSGIHYDLLMMNNGQVKFSPKDSEAQSYALSIASEARTRHQFTSTSSFKLECKDCKAQLSGEREAERHAELFGHSNFTELS